MRNLSHLFISGLLFAVLLIFGITHDRTYHYQDPVAWSELPLNWDQFRLVDELENNYAAIIYSGIVAPDLITESDSRVYAYMDPNQSARIAEASQEGSSVLIHEQYHFNLAEYCSRLLRRAIVRKGLEGMSYETLEHLRFKYTDKLEELQQEYDNKTDHNLNTDEQRQWVLKIDDWLRETALYKEPDIYNYFNFYGNNSGYYKEMSYTLTGKLLPSIPTGMQEMQYGEVYQVIYQDGDRLVKFYKDGVHTSGGIFETATLKIVRKAEGVVETHYLDADGAYNEKREYAIREARTGKDGSLVFRYFNAKQERVDFDANFEIRYDFNAKNNSYTSTFLNAQGMEIPNDEGISHVQKILDKHDRTIQKINLDRDLRMLNDRNLVARYTYRYNDNNQETTMKLYDANGAFAYHLQDYHLNYEYDERGNLRIIKSLDEKGNLIYDANGTAVYEYYYDRNDRVMLEKRFNHKYDPVVSRDGYHKRVTDYDSLGRIVFTALYLPGDVLKFNDNKWGATRNEYVGDSVVFEYNLNGYGEVDVNETGIAMVKKILNDRGEVLEEQYLDMIGRKAIMANGVHKFSYVYNDKGQLLQTTTYDSLGQATPFEVDIVKIVREYDSLGNPSRLACFDKDDQPVADESGVSVTRYQYGSDSQISSEWYFDEKGLPAARDGVHKWEYERNSKGLDAVVKKYGLTGNLIEGACIEKYTYNAYDRLTRKAFYNRNGQRTRNAEGVSAIAYRYDKRMLSSGEAYFDELDKPVNNNGGIAYEVYTLNAMGYTQSLQYLDKEHQPVPGPNGYHKIVQEWDEVGELKMYAMYDTGLRLMADQSGIATYEYELFPSGLTREIRRYDTSGVLANNTMGVALTRYRFTMNGLYYLEEELDANTALAYSPKQPAQNEDTALLE
ncbi:hypothetical protein [Robertkochia flava]|uniref:hypothetical protein n=1 Tax=Robertkochia flava TaxID=3447986 RepID=UPI001CCDF8A1|nr:hypothetical protein [Robertkochia marina]